MTILEAQTKLEPAREAAKMMVHTDEVNVAIQEAFALTAWTMSLGGGTATAARTLASILAGLASDPGVEMAQDFLTELAKEA